MSKEEILKLSELDEAADKAGGYLADPFKKDTHYDYRKILSYCREKGIEPLDLTIRELRDFILPA